MSEPEVHGLGPNRPIFTAPATIPDLTGKIVKLDDYYHEGGAFGDVYKCLYNSDDGVKEVAVKAFRFKFVVAERDGKCNKTSKMIRRELGIWRRLKHPNIVTFLGVVYEFGRAGSAALVSVWMPNGTLSNFLEEHEDQLTVSRRLQLLMDIANGLDYLHSFTLPVIHGDLTCSNVLVDENGIACLTDFGYATVIGEISEALSYLQMSTMRPGALRWAAPEHFSVDGDLPIQHTTKSDIYSFGNLALLVLSGKQPWSEVQRDAAVMVLLSRGEKPRRPESPPIRDCYWELINRCWSPVDQRPHARDLVFSLLDFLRTCLISLPPDDSLSVLSPLSTASPSGTAIPGRSGTVLSHTIAFDNYVESNASNVSTRGASSTLSKVTVEPLPDEMIIDYSHSPDDPLSEYLETILAGEGGYRSFDDILEAENRPSQRPPAEPFVLHPSRVKRVSQSMLESVARRPRHPAPFACDQCGQTFTALFSLKRHTQSHNGERPYQCQIPGCGQRFYNYSDCKRHEKSRKRHKDLLPQQSATESPADESVSEGHVVSEGSRAPPSTPTPTVHLTSEDTHDDSKTPTP